MPFRLHRTDCTPSQGELADPNDEDRVNNKVCMRHYGPVTWNPNDGQPFQVERRKAGSSDSWQLQDCFACELDEDNKTIVWVKTSAVNRFQRGFEDRVSLRTRSGDNERILRCDLPTGATPQVADYAPLIFTFCDADPARSPGDADDDGCVDAADITAIRGGQPTTRSARRGRERSSRAREFGVFLHSLDARDV